MNPLDGLWIIGAGGHAKVVVETARAAGEAVAGLIDDRPHLHGIRILGALVVGGTDSIPDGARCVVAIGDSRIRQKVVSELADRVTWATVIHPRAEVAYDVSIGPGTVVFAMAVVQTSSDIGQHAIINTAAVVEHDDRLADFAQLATGAKLTGAVTVGEGAFLGAGAVVLPGVAVGAWSVVGAVTAATYPARSESGAET